MRILMLTQWFAPEPFFKGLPFAKELVKRGHEVEALTGFPNYPGGKVYSGYRIKPWQTEEKDGVRIHRTALYPSHDQSGLRRMVNYLTFALTALFIGPWLVRKPDVVYVYNLITLAWAACFLRWLYGCKIVYDVQDLWPESVASSGMLNKPSVLRFLNIWSNWAYKKADHIVVLSPGFKSNLMARGIHAKKIDVIYNWSPEETNTLVPDENEQADFCLDTRFFNVVFAGTMGVMQGLDTVLDAARILGTKHSEARFVLVGGGVEVERLKSKAKDGGLDNVIFVPRQPVYKMKKILSDADVLLVHLKKDPLFEITIPSKTQAYLASGKPIIMAVKGDAADLVMQAEAGLVCEPEAPYLLANCVEKLLQLKDKESDALAKNGKNFYLNELSFNKGVDKFESVFGKVMKHKRQYKFNLSKVFFDYLITSVGLFFILPLLLLVALFVRLKIGSPVLFKQVRPGFSGKPYTMYKFRTMTNEKDEYGNLLPDDQRLTRFGRLLRSTSLDELPALLNVLKGEMSLVGPRPLLVEYLSLYNEEQRRRHEVRPGITGWAQVNGRNALSWEEKFKFDVWYVDNRSFWLDLKILFLTVKKVFVREGISAEGEATMPKFTGTKK